MRRSTSSIRFSDLMRILCQRNGGSFVGLDDPDRGGCPRIRIGDNDATPAAVATSWAPSSGPIAAAED